MPLIHYTQTNAGEMTLHLEIVCDLFYMDIETRFYHRRSLLQKRIGNGAAIIPSSVETKKSRDQRHHFRQDSNFFYLTGFSEPNSALLLLGGKRGPRSVIFLRERDPLKERYEGEHLGLTRAKRRFKIDEVRNIENLENDLTGLLKDHATLHYVPAVNPEVDSVVWRIFCRQSDPSSRFPYQLKDLRAELHQMRAVKDSYEINCIKRAIEITIDAFVKLASDLPSLKSEAHAAKLLEQYFTEFGASSLGFDTIVASGKNATTLHHSPLLSPILKQKLVLIDAGAEFNGYSADISRTFPVSGKFSTAEKEIYNLVLAALETAQKRVHPQATANSIHLAAVKEITKGLIDLKIIKDKDWQTAFTGEKYKPYFMHRTSHFLGLDVHDPPPPQLDGSITHSEPLRLQPGHVITVEPGLYFDSRDMSIPRHFRGIGIRLENDVLVTPHGGSVLTSRLPVSLSDVEELLK